MSCSIQVSRVLGSVQRRQYCLGNQHRTPGRMILDIGGDCNANDAQQEALSSPASEHSAVGLGGKRGPNEGAAHLQPGVDEPVEALELVVPQLAPREVLGLRRQRAVALAQERLALYVDCLGGLQQPRLARLHADATPASQPCPMMSRPAAPACPPRPDLPTRCSCVCGCVMRYLSTAPLDRAHGSPQRGIVSPHSVPNSEVYSNTGADAGMTTL